MTDFQIKQPAFIDRLWEAFEAAMLHPPLANGRPAVDLRQFFGGMPPQAVLHFALGEGEGVITTQVMKSLQDYQTAALKAYAAIMYGSPRLKVIPPAIRKDIQIKYFVKSGTTTIEADIKDAIISLLHGAIDKMENWHLLILAAVFILAFMSKEGFKLWIERQKSLDDRKAALEERRIDADKDRIAQEQETERMRLLAQAFTRIPQAVVIDRQAGEGMAALTRAAIATRGAEVVGLRLTQDEAADLLRGPRKEREGMSQNGLYLVKRINFDYEPGQLYGLHHCETGEEFIAEAVPVEVSSAQLETLSRLAHAKEPVRLKVNVSRYGGVVTRAFILGVDS